MNSLEWRYVGRSGKSHLFSINDPSTSVCGTWLVMQSDLEPDEQQTFEDKPMEGDCKICHRKAKKGVLE